MYKKIVDLSHDLKTGMMVFPGDPEVHIYQACNVLEHGFAVSCLEMGSHSGTHIDAPAHFLEDKNTVSDFDISHFLSRGICMDLSYKKPLEPILPKDIKPYLKAIQKGDFAIFNTGFSQYFGRKHYLKHPHLHIDTVLVLLELGVRAFLIDALSVDSYQDESFPAHYAILSANAIIGENFNNLDKIDFKEPLISILPIKIKKADGAPVRAVAIQL